MIRCKHFVNMVVKYMSFLYFLLGGLIAVVWMASFSVRAYEKGYIDAIKDILNATSDDSEDEEYLQYKKQLKDFMATINPKPTLDDLDRLKQQYLEARK
jgi:hypothetical protein